MLRNKTPLIIGLVVIVIVLAVLLVVFMPSGGTDWRKTYNPDSKQPYGTEVIKDVLPGMLGQTELNKVDGLLYKALPKVIDTGQTYFFLGGHYFLNDSSIAALLQFVERGNKAIILSNSFPSLLTDTLKLVCSNSERATWQYFTYSPEFNFYHPSLYRDSAYTFYNIVRSDTVFSLWSYFNYTADSCLEAAVIPLGYIDETDYNFLALNHGAGTIYLHSNPIAFTNLPMTNADGREYAEKALSHLPNAPVWWDTKSHIPVSNSDRLRQTAEPTGTPLQYILGEPSLRWGWYVLLAGVLIFILFRAKRQQRIVPVREDNLNTSLKYIETVGQLYYQQRDHRKLALKQMHFFLVWLKRNFRIAAFKTDQPPLELLAARTGVEESKFENLFNHYQNIQNKPDIDDDELIQFYGLIEHVYKNTKQ